MVDREGAIAFGAPTATGRRGNPFGLGSALLWAPSVAGAALLARVAAAAGAPIATDGFGTLTLYSVHAGSWACALVALWLVSHTLARAFGAVDARARGTAVAAAAFGTPLPYYIFQLPSYSHAAAAFAAALVLGLAWRWRDAWSPRRATLLGLSVGLAALVRPQDVVLVLVPLLVARPWRAPGT